MISSTPELVLSHSAVVLKSSQPATKRSRFVTQGRALLLTLALALAVTDAHGGNGHRAGGPPASPTDTSFTIDLRDYGATGDGVTDDGPALKSALEALADAGGGRLMVSDGRYVIASPVSVDFSNRAAAIVIEGTPSASPYDGTAGPGQTLNLTSEFVIKTGATADALTIQNLPSLRMENLVLIGDPLAVDDARVVLKLSFIDSATVNYCEFYGLSSTVASGAIVQAVGSNLKITDSAFLGCASNSGLYTSIVQLHYWHGVTITGTRFVDYGNRPDFYSKTPLQSPFAWVSVGGAAPLTSESPRRDVIIKNVFLDEGAYFAFSVRPDFFPAANGGAISLIYLSQLYVNVTNLGEVGAQIWQADSVFIENSHFGWSHHSLGALDLAQVKNAVLNEIECVLSADRINVAESVAELSVVNSVYNTLNSQAPVTRVITTDDAAAGPGRYVNQKYLDITGHEPDVPGYVYWTQKRARCNDDAQCTTDEELSNYLDRNPAATFALSGRLLDDGEPVVAATVSLSGTHAVSTLTDAQGFFTFSGLATSGEYTVTPAKTFYSFKTNDIARSPSKSFVTPGVDQRVDFTGTLATYSIQGRVNNSFVAAVGGVTMTLTGGPAGFEAQLRDTSSNGDYSFEDLPAGYTYAISAEKPFNTFAPAVQTVVLTGETGGVNFIGTTDTFSINGVIADGSTPLTNASVTLSGAAQQSTATTSSGAYRFEEVPAGQNYVLTVTKQHYTFSSYSLNNLTEDSNIDFNGQIIQYVITGNVTLNSNILSGVTITLSGDQAASRVTNSTDGYAFTVNAGGNYLISATKTGYAFTPESIVLNELGQNIAADFVAHEAPLLLTNGATNRAIAFNSVTMVTEPFKLFTTPFDFGPDRRTRVSLFALRIPDDPLLITAQAEDVHGNVYPLSVDAVGSLSGVTEFKQINLRLDSQLATGADIKISIKVGGIPSTPVLLRIE